MALIDMITAARDGEAGTQAKAAIDGLDVANQLFTKAQGAAYLGCSTRTLERMEREGRIAFVRRNERCVRIRGAELRRASLEFGTSNIEAST